MHTSRLLVTCWSLHQAVKNWQAMQTPQWSRHLSKPGHRCGTWPRWGHGMRLRSPIFFGVAQGTLLPVWYWAYQIFFGCKEGTRLEAAHKPALANTGSCPQHVAQPSSFPEGKTCPKHCRLGRPLHWKRLRHWPAHSNSRIGMWWGTVPYKQAYIACEPAFWHYMIRKKRLPQD